MPAIEMSITEMIDEHLFMWKALAPHEQDARKTTRTAIVELLCLINRSDVIECFEMLLVALQRLKAAQIVDADQVQQSLEHVTAEKLLRRN